MKKIKNFKDFLSSVHLSDLKKIYLIASSDESSFSTQGIIPQQVATSIFQFLSPEALSIDLLDPDMPVYNYGNRSDVKELLADKQFKTGNVYNKPEYLSYASNKLKFHKRIGDVSFIPKTVFTAEDARKLTFPIIAKPKLGSRSRGIVVFDNKDDFDKHDKKDLDIYCKKINIVKEYRILSIKGKPIYIAERVPVNKKAKAIREGQDIFMTGLDQDVSKFDWKVRSFGTGDTPEINKLAAIANPVFKSLKIDILGLDICIDDKGKLWLIEANTCPGLNNDQMIVLYINIFEDFYGRKPDKFTMQKLNTLGKELRSISKSDVKFSGDIHNGKRMDIPNSVQKDIERSFGKSLSDIK